MRDNRCEGHYHYGCSCDDIEAHDLATALYGLLLAAEDGAAGRFRIACEDAHAALGQWRSRDEQAIAEAEG